MSTRAERIKALHKAAAERILIMDGAMGTEIQNFKLDEAGYRALQRWRFKPGTLVRAVFPFMFRTSTVTGP